MNTSLSAVDLGLATKAEIDAHSKRHYGRDIRAPWPSGTGRRWDDKRSWHYREHRHLMKLLVNRHTAYGAFAADKDQLVPAVMRIASDGSGKNDWGFGSL